MTKFGAVSNILRVLVLFRLKYSYNILNDGDDNDIEIDGKEEGNTEERPGIFDFINGILA